MRKILTTIVLLAASLPLLALSCDDISSENLVSLLEDAGYTARVDEEGDVEFEDSYGMVYYIVHVPSERRLWIQCGWYASDWVDSSSAFRLMNECNSSLTVVRGWYEPLSHSFFWDYDLLYSEAGLDDDLFIYAVASFVRQSDILTDFLISEGA